MAALGALAENQRRGERADRGVITVPSSGVAFLTIDPRVNASITQFLVNPNGELGSMRFMTHFELTVDDNGTRLGSGNTIGSIVSGSINTANQTINSIVYLPATVLSINVYAIGATGLLVAPAAGSTRVRWTVWGALMNQGSATVTGGPF